MGARAADRLSVAVSGLLIGGALLVGLALLLQEQASTQNSDQRVMSPTPRKVETGDMPMAIRLPPPPARPVPVPATVAPLPREPAPPARVVEPLKTLPRATKTSPSQILVPLHLATAVPRPEAAQLPNPPGPVIEAAPNRKTGGALLRLLEHGKGPTIEIAWPSEASDRRRLYRALTRCSGMQAAVLDGTSRLFVSGGTAGQPWDLDRNRVSGFLRSPQGEAIAEEVRSFAAIASHHDLAGWRPVRVFPRDVDAALLGGLARLLGPRYSSARSITAAYVLNASGLTLDRFRVDDVPAPGAISLAPHRAGCA